MRSLSLRPKAREDLEHIADYTLEKWGERREEVYLGILNQAFSLLVKNPDHGRPRR